MGGVGGLRELWGAPQVSRRVEELARRISRDYRGRELLLVGILKGSFVFLADLVLSLLQRAIW